jgi:MarR family transcriptional regulator, 2-MHQ and catechol-resistance regulon repressor
VPTIGEELVSRFENEQQKAALNILFTSNWLRSQHATLLAPFGLSMQQYNILRILRGAKGEKMNMHSVKERMIDRAPNATRLTDKLLTKTLVERERCDQDRRVVYIRITPKGLDLLRAMDDQLKSHWVQVNGRISDADARVVNRALDLLRG